MGDEMAYDYDFAISFAGEDRKSLRRHHAGRACRVMLRIIAPVDNGEFKIENAWEKRKNCLVGAEPT